MIKRIVRIVVSFAVGDERQKEELFYQLNAIQEAQALQELYISVQSLPLPNGELAVESDVKSPATIFLFLISKAYLRLVDFKQFWVELERYKKSGFAVIPVILDDCDWQKLPIQDLNIQPYDKRPISHYPSKEGVFRQIAATLLGISSEKSEALPANLGLAYEVISMERKNRTGKLDISGYKLEEIPNDVFEMKWLTALTAGDEKNTMEHSDLKRKNKERDFNNIRAIPPGIKKLVALTSLYLEGNQISDIRNLERLVHLEHLDLSSNRLSNIESLKVLKKLKFLSLSRNSISDISALAALAELEFLELDRNQIYDISPLGSLHNLRSLDVYRNKIEDISILRLLTNLEYLRVSTNQIKEITALGELHKLKRIRLSENQIEDLSPLFGHIEKGLVFINSVSPKDGQISVASNPLKVPDVSYIIGGRETQLAFIKSYDEQLKFAHSNVLKVIVLGNSNCGKTTLRKYLAKSPDYMEQQTTTRLEIEKIKWPLNNQKKSIELRLLDFGGQEYFHGTYPLFFSLETLYIVVWAVDENRYKLEDSREVLSYAGSNDKKSVENEDFDVSYWLNSIEIITTRKNSYLDELSLGNPDMPKEYIPKQRVTELAASNDATEAEQARAMKNIPILLIQNKVDVNGVAYEDMKTFADTFKRFDIDTLSISLYSRSRLDTLENILSNKILETNAHLRRVPEKWMKLLKGLRKKHMKEKIISYEAFAGAARLEFPNKSKYNEDYVKAIGKYFHATHEIIFFGDIGEGKIVLDTEWFIDVIYKIISSVTNIIHKGIVTEKNLHEILGKSFTKTKDLIEILKESNILFDYKTATASSHEPCYILPQLLPLPEFGADKLLYESFKEANVIIRFRYHLHRISIQALYGLLNQQQEDAEYRFLYKNGIVVKKGEAMVFIKINQEEKQIEFKTTKYAQENNDFIKTLDLLQEIILNIRVL